MAEKPRILQDGRDMMWSLIPLAVLVMIIAGIAGSCSWGFGDNSDDRVIPHFDASAGLHADASTMAFPIRDPHVPDTWESNSGSTQELESTVSSNVGWITGDGEYVQLTQTDADEESLMRHLLGDEASGSGVHQIAGHTWVAYENPDHKKTWIANFGDVRISVTSTGPDANLTDLADAVSAAAPIESNRPRPTG